LKSGQSGLGRMAPRLALGPFAPSRPGRTAGISVQFPLSPPHRRHLAFGKIGRELASLVTGLLAGRIRGGSRGQGRWGQAWFWQAEWGLPAGAAGCRSVLGPATGGGHSWLTCLGPVVEWTDSLALSMALVIFSGLADAEGMPEAEGNSLRRQVRSNRPGGLGSAAG